jgi:HAD superfamily hydrolase (TIGR01509 family)
MRNWVFDLDGTLVDSFAHYFSALDEIFAAHGRRFAPELRKDALTESLDRFFAHHLGSAAVRPAFERLHVRSNEDARLIRPFAGLETIVTRLRQRGARVAVWTNRDLASASLILEHSGWQQHTEAMVSGTCVTLRKPHPEGLLRLIERFGCDPSEVTMVGDHEHDVTAAKTIGARAVRASWHAYWSERDCGTADAQFRSVEEFGAWALA